MEHIAHAMRIRRIDQRGAFMLLTTLALLVLAALTGCATARRPACDASLSVTAAIAREPVPALPAAFTPIRYRRALEVEPAATLTCTWSLTTEAR